MAPFGLWICLLCCRCRRGLGSVVGVVGIGAVSLEQWVEGLFVLEMMVGSLV